MYEIDELYVQYCTYSTMQGNKWESITYLYEAFTDEIISFFPMLYVHVQTPYRPSFTHLSLLNRFLKQLL